MLAPAVLYCHLLHWGNSLFPISHFPVPHFLVPNSSPQSQSPVPVAWQLFGRSNIYHFPRRHYISNTKLIKWNGYVFSFVSRGSLSILLQTITQVLHMGDQTNSSFEIREASNLSNIKTHRLLLKMHYNAHIHYLLCWCWCFVLFLFFDPNFLS